MDYQKSYPHPRLAGETIVLQWTRGYTSVKVWFRNRELIELKNAKQLLKGITFKDDEVGDVTVQLSRKPYFLNVLVDGYHSSLNTLHPAKVYPDKRFWFIVPIIAYGVAMIGNSRFLTGGEYQPGGETIFFGYSSFFFVITIVIYFSIQQKKVWPAIIWFIMICLQGLLFLSIYAMSLFHALSNPETRWTVLGLEDLVLSITSIVLYSGFLYLVYRLILKPGWGVWKHEKFKQPVNEELIDLN